MLVMIAGSKYKFGLYFNSSFTTDENPLWAALNSGVAPSYQRRNNIHVSIQNI